MQGRNVKLIEKITEILNYKIEDFTNYIDKKVEKGEKPKEHSINIKEICEVIDMDIVVYGWDIKKKQLTVITDDDNDRHNKLKFYSNDKTNFSDIRVDRNKFYENLAYYRDDAVPVYSYENETYDEFGKIIEKQQFHYDVNIEGKSITKAIKEHEDGMNVLKNIIKKSGIFKGEFDKKSGKFKDEFDKKWNRSLNNPRNVLINVFSEAFSVMYRGEAHTELENEFIENCSRGPILYTKKNYKMNEKFYQLDQNGSYFSHIKTLKFPVGGAIETTTFDKNDIGMYLVKYLSKVPKYLKDTNGNEKRYCTSYDLLLFEEIGLKYEIVSGIKYKYWIDMQKFKLGELFDEMYRNRNKAIKESYKNFWGFLSQTNITYGLSMDEIRKGDVIKRMNATTFLFDVRKACFKYDYKFPFLCRIKHFIQSYCRFHFGIIVNDLKNLHYKVIKIKTDCIVTNATPEEINEIFPLFVGKELGDFKLEKEFEIGTIIKNSKQLIELDG